MDILLLTIIFLSIILLLIGLYKKYKKLIYFSIFCIICVIAYVLIRKYILDSKKEDFVNFSFKRDDQNVKESPEIYCGESKRLPKNYDAMGTRYRCMKKGIGIGMNLPDEQREEFLSKPKDTTIEKEKLYCGNDLLLPENYDRFGSKKECLRKGVGVGLGMPQQKRLRAQQKSTSKLGKREIMDLARRLKIDTDDLTRKQSVLRIANRLLQLNT
jgi:hypothetical protein